MPFPIAGDDAAKSNAFAVCVVATADAIANAVAVPPNNRVAVRNSLGREGFLGFGFLKLRFNNMSVTTPTKKNTPAAATKQGNIFDWIVRATESNAPILLGIKIPLFEKPLTIVVVSLPMDDTH